MTFRQVKIYYYVLIHEKFFIVLLFMLPQGVSHLVFLDTVAIIREHAREFIPWPTLDEMQDISNTFNFRNAFGMRKLYIFRNLKSK